MEIKVTSVSDPKTVAKGQRNWKEITVEYTNQKGNGKKVLRDFADPDCFKTFTGLVQAGDKVNVDIKKEGDYWNWKGASVLDTGLGAEGVGSSSNNRGGAATTTNSSAKKGDWETSGERAAKQRYIVRQSSIANAITYTSMANPKSGIDEVIEIAKKFERFVFGEDVNPSVAVVKKAVGRPKTVPIVEEGEDDIEEIS